MKKINIGLGFDKMRILHDGLGEYSCRLARYFAERAPELEDRHGIRFHCHMRSDLHGIFGEDVDYLGQHKNQKYWHRTDAKFDLWHSMNQHVKFAAPRGTKHWVMTVHDFNFLHDPACRRKKKTFIQTYLLTRRADSIIAISDFVADEVRDVMKFRRPVQRIHNGAAVLDSDGVRPKLLKAGRGQYLLHLSRMAPSKNPRAIVHLASTWPDQQFVFAGPSGSDVDVVRQIIELRSLKNIQILEDVSEEEKAWLYRNCSGFLLPSLTEGFGLTVIEAMSQGKPVFLSRKTCLPEIGGPLAFYWDHFRPQHMREVIEDGLQKASISGYSDAVRSYASKFTWEQCASEYLEYYLRKVGVPCESPSV